MAQAPGNWKSSLAARPPTPRNRSKMSSAAVFRHERSPGGFREQVFIMFHGTDDKNADSILTNGFKLSDHNSKMLGKGIYVSFDFDKAAKNGNVVFKLLVYAGMVCKIDRRGHPMQKAWQAKFDSAWVPPHSGVNPSGQQENCIKDNNQIHILGVCRGYNLLSPTAKNKLKDLTQVSKTKLSCSEDQELKKFVSKLGLGVGGHGGGGQTSTSTSLQVQGAAGGAPAGVRPQPQVVVVMVPSQGQSDTTQIGQTVASILQNSLDQVE